MAGLVPASYPISPTDTLAIEYAKTKIRPWVDLSTQADGINHGGWQDIGELDYFKQNVSTTAKEVWTKSTNVSQLLLTTPTKLKSECSFKVMNRSQLMRAYSMLGSVAPINQAAGQVTYTGVVQAGETHYIGAYNVTGVAVQGVDPAYWSVVDMAAGAVQFSPNVPAADIGQPFTITASAPARTSYEIVAGGQPVIDVEMILRGVSDVGQKGLLHILRFRINPKGDQDYISSNDDFNGFEFSGNALLTSHNGVNAAAVWTPLDA